jgi:hypothetical protein
VVDFFVQAPVFRDMRYQMAAAEFDQLRKAVTEAKPAPRNWKNLES